jgi:AraC-like protein
LANLGDSLLRWSEWVLAPKAASTASAEKVFRSADVDETRHAIARVYSEHELDVVGPSTQFDAALGAWNLGKVTIGYVRHGTEVVIRPGRLGSYYGSTFR